ncbi:uncharacterized protein [Epargyreus clarus]|uniref:uncharacterized protein n=1 Tax=Epargyreus clarus TaxID=520877 RepID=UPI003C2F38BE
MASEESDIELQSALPKKIAKKPPKSPSEEMLQSNQDPKKMATKDMIHQALIDLKSRKGASLHAIKKYIQEKYKVDVEKLNYIIKKSIKTSVEAGIIVQTKGVGASGSFKLAPGKDKPEKKKKKPKSKKSAEKPIKSEKTEKAEKPKKAKSIESDAQPKKKLTISKSSTSEAEKDKSKKESEKSMKNEPKMKKTKATKMAKGLQTPAKKKGAMMKRKSIGSIIKPPKMNPKKG